MRVGIVATATAVAIVTITFAIAIAPHVDEITPTAVRMERFQYHPGRVGSSACSTFGDQALLCGASVLGTYSQCGLAKDGQQLRVEFVQLRILFGAHEAAIRATDGDPVVYELTPAGLGQNWIKRSLFDVLYVSLLAGFACYAVLVAFSHSADQARP